VLRSAARRARVFVAVTALLDAITAVYYGHVRSWSTLYFVGGAALNVAYLILIWAVLRSVVKAQEEKHPRRPGAVPLFRFVVPFIVSVGVAFAAVLAADATCTTAHHAEECISYGPPIASAFFDQAAHIIAVLLIGLAIEARLLVEQQGAEHREERALVTITVLGRALGIAASLTASAADAQKLPFTFPLTVEALALGLATIVQLPRLKPDKAG